MEAHFDFGRFNGDIGGHVDEIAKDLAGLGVVVAAHAAGGPAVEHPEGARRIAEATRRLSRGEPLHEVSPQGFVLALAWGRRLRKELPRVC